MDTFPYVFSGRSGRIGMEVVLVEGGEGGSGECL